MTESNPFRDRLVQAAKEGYMTPKREFRPQGTRTLNADGFPVTRYQADQVKASRKQLAYIRDLLDQRDLSAESRPKWAARLAQLVAVPQEVENLDFAAASKLIEYLLGMPTRPLGERPDKYVSVAAGRYGVMINGELWFVKVDRPETGKWAGRVFVKRQNGPSLDRLFPNVQDRVLAAIVAQGPAACSAAYGRELGICGLCNTELTNAESRAYGIGPKCRTKYGW